MNPVYMTVAFKRLDDLLACDPEMTLGNLSALAPSHIFRTLDPERNNWHAYASLLLPDSALDAFVNRFESGAETLYNLDLDIEDQTFTCYDCGRMCANDACALQFCGDTHKSCVQCMADEREVLAEYMDAPARGWEP